MLLDRVEKALGDRIKITWRYFSLEQVNSKQGPDWKVWDHWPDVPSKGIPSFMAAEAARRQGEAAFKRYNLALLTARHVDGRDLTERATLVDTARRAGLDVDRFERDLDDRSLLDRLAADHTYAVETFGTFGTPTFVFKNGRAAYLRIRPVPPEEEMLTFWEQLYAQIAHEPYLLEFKRPVLPKKA